MLVLTNSVSQHQKVLQLTVTDKEAEPIVEAIAFGLKVVAIATAFRILTR
jgi:hypothetical protein